MSFKKSNYQEKITKITLSNKTIKEIEFEECEFTDCSFIDCKFEKCKFIACRFDDCVVSAMGVTDSRFIDVTFTKNKVIGIDWIKAQHLEDINFEDCQLNYSNFKLLTLPKIIIRNCEAKEVEFIEADLSEGNFENTDFEKSIFSKTNLAKANFKGAKNYFIDIKNNDIKKAKFFMPEALSLLDSLDVEIS